MHIIQLERYRRRMRMGVYGFMIEMHRIVKLFFPLIFCMNGMRAIIR